MIFYYQPIISNAPDGQDFVLILRPEIPVTLNGPGGKGTYTGLVDTGSDNTIFPKSVADRLGIALNAESGPPAIVFGGNRVQLLVGTATIELEADGEIIQWSAAICFHDFGKSEDETLILGHSGFLDYFTATFDGQLGTLKLIPNSDLPVPRAGAE